MAVTKGAQAGAGQRFGLGTGPGTVAHGPGPGGVRQEEA